MRPGPTGRAVPRSFALHWGRGLITEEATASTRYHARAIQLLEFEDGARSIRSCYHDLRAGSSGVR